VNGVTATSPYSATASGNYTIIATDVNGCTATQQVTIAIPTAINLMASGNNLSCSGQNGSIVFSATGGTGVITYKVNDIAATSPYTVTVAGTYTIVATDANGCTNSKQVVISASSSTLILTATGTNPICNGQNGSITFNASGASGTVIYKVNNIVATSPYAVTVAGTYTITATDASGCTATQQVTITTPSVINLSAIGINPPCAGQNGSILFIATGGSGSITYKVNNRSATSPYTTAPVSGTYVLRAEDSKGCYATRNIVISIPTTITLTATGTNPTCGGTNGTIAFSATGGTGTLTYKVNNVAATSPYPATASGAYSIVVTDAKGCNVTKSVTITIPSAINLSATATNPNCFGQNGSIVFRATGGTGTITYKVNNVTARSPYAASTSGTYTILATDSKGCTATKQVTVSIPTAIVLTATATNPKCYGQSGTIAFSATGGTGSITYKVNNVTAISPYTVSVSGSYTILATDNKGCTASKIVTITTPTAVIATISTATSNTYCNALTLTGSSTALAPLTYEWFNPSGTLVSTVNSISLNNSNADGNYSLYITDANKCKSTAAATYNYLKQNLLGNYTILGLKDVALGQGNIVNGAVGNTASGKSVSIGINSTINGFVKASVIRLNQPVTVTGSLVYSPAAVTIPVLQINTATLPTSNLSVSDNATTTISTNYNNLTIGKAAVVTVNGTIYGTITIGEGAQVTFTQASVNIKSLVMNSGKLNVNYTTANFNGTAVKIKSTAVIGDRCRVNAANAIFHMSDQVADVEKFSVSSSDTRFNGNILMPKGKLQLKGTVGPLVMTGNFIAENIASAVAATWNGNTCTSNLFARNQDAPSQTLINNGDYLSFEVFVSPNPSSTDFKLNIISPKHELVNIKIFDATGSLQSELKGKYSGSESRVGSQLKSGTYFSEIIKGNETKVVTLIKLN